MTARRVIRLTTAAALATSVIGLGVGTASAATTTATAPRTATTSFPCSDSGVGATQGLADNNAKQNLIGDYTVLSGITISYNTQEPDGSWYAVASARCGEPR